MCRKYGSPPHQFIRLCARTRCRGWRLYAFRKELPDLKEGHITLKIFKSGSYILKAPERMKRYQIPAPIRE
jgi:hypothetical protein